MTTHPRTTTNAGSAPPQEASLAFRIASVAADRVPVERDVAAMIVDRMIDIFAVSIAAIGREDVTRARDMALGHPARDGAAVFGCGARRGVSPEWAALANGEALCALDFQDGFLGAAIARPAETIPPLLAVAQSQGRSGRDLLRAIAAATEIHIQLARAGSVTSMASLCAAQAAGLGTLLKLPHATIVHAVQIAACAGMKIASASPHAPSAAAGKRAVEVMDGAMRGQRFGEGLGARGQGVPACLPLCAEDVWLPASGVAKRALLESFPHEHAAPCLGQAVIDLALRVRDRAGDPAAIEKIVLHTAMGAGGERIDGAWSSNAASKLARIFVIALQDGRFHHGDSTTVRRASRDDTAALCRKTELRGGGVTIPNGPEVGISWPALGARVEIVRAGATRIDEALAVAHAHPRGAQPFARKDYIEKFEALTDGLIAPRESARLIEALQDLPRLGAGELPLLAAAIPPIRMPKGRNGIFRVSA